MSIFREQTPPRPPTSPAPPVQFSWPAPAPPTAAPDPSVQQAPMLASTFNPQWIPSSASKRDSQLPPKTPRTISSAPYVNRSMPKPGFSAPLNPPAPTPPSHYQQQAQRMMPQILAELAAQDELKRLRAQDKPKQPQPIPIQPAPERWSAGTQATEPTVFKEEPVVPQPPSTEEPEEEEEVSHAYADIYDIDENTPSENVYYAAALSLGWVKPQGNKRWKQVLHVGYLGVPTWWLLFLNNFLQFCFLEFIGAPFHKLSRVFIDEGPDHIPTTVISEALCQAPLLFSGPAGNLTWSAGCVPESGNVSSLLLFTALSIFYVSQFSDFDDTLHMLLMIWNGRSPQIYWPRRDNYPLGLLVGLQGQHIDVAEDAGRGTPKLVAALWPQSVPGSLLPEVCYNSNAPLQSPAIDANLREPRTARPRVNPGDEILQVDGQPVQHMTLAGVKDAMRGPAGSVITVGLRSPVGELTNVWMVRDFDDEQDKLPPLFYGPVAKWAAIVFLVIPKFIVTLMLVHYGSLFLAATASNTDIILNATALAFITEIDELLYAQLAADPVKSRMSRVVYSMRISPAKGPAGGLSGALDKVLALYSLLRPYLHAIFMFVFAAMHMRSCPSNLEQTLSSEWGRDINWCQGQLQSTGAL